jgi:LysM repeat protein
MQMRTLAGLSYDETNPADTSKAPSLVVYRAGQGDSLWNLAKKNRSTAKLIAEANALENEDNVAGQLLIIPKRR